MDYCIGVSRGNKEKNAGAKAPDDILNICKEMGMSIFLIPTSIENTNIFQKIFWKLIVPYIYWFKFYLKVRANDRVVLQHPLVNNNRALNFFIPRIRKKGVKVITLIHDLTTLRTSGRLETKEIKELAIYDKIICHNESMKRVLLEAGFSEHKLIVLEIFDYLTDSKPQSKAGDDNTIVIAGNLSPDKCNYIYELAENNPNLPVNLYGVGLDESRITDNIVYKGSYSPEALIENIEGKFGLVWDGNSIDNCTGNMREYLKYNNPHKTSLFIVSELPIIVWRQAAIAEFVTKNKIGIAVEDLESLDRTLKDVSAEDYQLMLKNIKQLSQELRSGYYTKTAILKAWNN